MKAFIVDDEADICKYLWRELKKAGCEVEYSTSAVGVMERLHDAEKEEKPYELLLLDLRMPKVGGFELLKQIRETRLDLDTIIITGYGDEEKAIEALRLGAMDYLPKPISLAELHTAVFRIQQKRAAVAKKAFRHHILVVDDEKDLCDRIKRELDKEGYQTAVAYDGHEGLNYFKDNRVDVVIADIRMPRMSGLEMLERCRAITGDFVSLIITGHGDHSTAIEALKLGVFDYLKKPISLEDLVVSVDKAIDLLLLRRGLSARRRELEIETAIKEQYARNLEKMVEERTKEIKKLSDAVKASTESIVVSDLEGKITDVNAATLRMYGTANKQDLIGRSSFDLLAPEDQEKAIAGMKEVMEQGYVRDREYHVVTRDGGRLPVEMSVAVMKNVDDQPVGFVGVSRDISERARAEEALRESEARYRTVVEAMPALVCRFSADGTLTFVNEAYCTYIGRKRADLIGKDLFDVIPEEYCAKVRRQLDALTQEQPTVTYQNRLTGPDGEELYQQWTEKALFAEDGSIAEYQSVGIDVTERVRAEQALRQSEARYRLLAENAADVIWTIGMDLRLTYVSPSATRLTGYTVEEIIALTIEELLTPDSAEVALKAFAEEMATEAAGSEDPSRTLTLELEYVCKDGSPIWTESVITFLRNTDGQPVGLLWVTRDITERARLEEALWASYRHQTAILGSMLDVLIVANPDGTIRTVNHAALELLGYAEEEIIGRLVGIIFEEEEEEEEEEEFFRSTGLVRLMREGTARDVELTLVAKSGERIPVAFNGSVIREEDGRLAAVLGVARDMRERKRAEEERTRLEAALRQSQKMEAIGSLAGGVAHDFNNILTVIQGYTDFALMSLSENDPIWRDLNEVRRASARAANLIGQLLLFSRRQPMAMSPLNINRTIQDLTKMLGRLVGEEITLTANLEPDLWTIEGDAGTIEQVAMNLVVNSRDALTQGGEITIQTQNRRVDEVYCQTRTYARPGEFVCLSVTDKGIGMSPDIMDHLFEPFFTTKGPGKGTGMGLPVVYGIVKQHQGWIDVESSPGQGTTFGVYLPATYTQPTQEQESPASTEVSRGKGERILLVEDEDSLREFATRGLSQHGYVVYPAASAQEALDIFKQEEGEFDLVFCDLVLTDGSGLKLAQRLLDLRPDTSVIFTSGYSAEKTDWRVIQEEGYPFLQKPYSLSDLLGVVSEVLG